MGGIAGLFGDRHLRRIYSYEDARHLAALRLPRVVFNYVDGGADSEVALARNVAAFSRVTLRNQAGVWHPEPDLSTDLFGVRVSMPVISAPAGGMRLVHPDGELGIARAANSAGVICITPTLGGFTLEQISKSPGVKWFQLYKMSSTKAMQDLVHRAGSAGYSAIVATIDTHTTGYRERELRDGYKYNMRPGPRAAVRFARQVAPRPRWLTRYLLDGMPFDFPNARPYGGPKASWGREAYSPTWADIDWIRENWQGPLIVKGVMTATDARRAGDCGANAVVVSNHGGRQLDTLPSTLEALEAVVSAVGSCMKVFLDSGIRRGSDVIKAIALGADAVLVGRPLIWGLAVGGERGVDHMFELIRDDISRNLCLMGAASIGEVDRSWLWTGEPLG